MARDMNKTLERYNSKFGNRPCSRSAHFTINEIEQIMEKSNHNFEAAAYGLEAGFILGYELAKREEKKK